MLQFQQKLPKSYHCNANAFDAFNSANEQGSLSLDAVRCVAGPHGVSKPYESCKELLLL